MGKRTTWRLHWVSRFHMLHTLHAAMGICCRLSGFCCWAFGLRWIATPLLMVQQTPERRTLMAMPETLSPPGIICAGYRWR